MSTNFVAAQTAAWTLRKSQHRTSNLIYHQRIRLSNIEIIESPLPKRCVTLRDFLQMLYTLSGSVAEHLCVVVVTSLAQQTVCTDSTCDLGPTMSTRIPIVACAVVRHTVTPHVHL